MTKKFFALIAGMACLAAVQTHAEIRTQTVEYKEGETSLEGFIAYDDAIISKRPAVIIAHQWKGLSDYEKERARMLAKLGYVAFAADVYGKGVRPTDPKDASAEAGKYKKDRDLLRKRIEAALTTVRTNQLVAKDQIAAIGYCFGGLTALELARSGADVKGVVSFHGDLTATNTNDARNVKGKVLALHGADDPFVPPAQVQAFEEEMRGAKVDWQLISYGNAVHSFTDWNAKGTMKGSEYNEKADKRSWEAMKDFLAEALPRNNAAAAPKR